MEQFLSFLIGLTIGLSLYFGLVAYISIRMMKKELKQISNNLTSMSASIYTLTLALDEHKKEVDSQLLKKEKQILKGWTWPILYALL